jgi:(1->4)-alpha-D-glucan 1-alpha-D-glucosylmutase
LLATSTHDTKRSEDVRLRIALLSELPEEWIAFGETWMQRAHGLPGGASVDPRTLYFVLQTLVGVWPISHARLHTYLLKAVREAKAWTSWLSPDLTREKALGEFTQALLLDGTFVEEVEALIRRLQPAFERHALSLTLLKLSSPGVPDLYQGTELWDFSLADPDNRRPVDFALREQLLARLSAGAVAPEAADQAQGAAKLRLILRALELRRERPECFDARGTYLPLDVEGEERQRIVAFQRGQDVVSIAPRLTLSLERWGDTRVRLPPGRFRDVLSGVEVESGYVDVLLRHFPVALLVRS